MALRRRKMHHINLRMPLKTQYISRGVMITNSWSNEGTLGTDINIETPHAAITINDIIYFNYNWGDQIGTYNFGTQQFVTPMNPSPPNDIPHGCLTTDGDFVYALGGYDGSGWTSEWQVFDIENNMWQSNTQNMNIERDLAACQAHNGVYNLHFRRVG
eukprot:227163_1